MGPISVQSSFHAHQLCMALQGSELVKDLLNIEVVGVLNQAFCHLHHYKFCPRTEELMTQCGMVRIAHSVNLKPVQMHCRMVLCGLGPILLREPSHMVMWLCRLTKQWQSWRRDGRRWRGLMEGICSVWMLRCAHSLCLLSIRARV